MRKISTIIFAFLCFLNANAQDIITLKDRKLIYAHIIEKSNTAIKYKLDSITNGDTTYSLKLSKIRTIHYNDGKVDLLSSQNPRSIFPLGINGGISLLGFTSSIDYLFTPNISAEINIGGLSHYVKYTYSFGGKYWFSNKYSNSGFSPFAGLLYGGIGLLIDGDKIMGNFCEVPIGISYFTKFGLQTSLQLSYLQFFHNEFSEGVPNIEFKIGWRFK